MKIEVSIGIDKFKITQQAINEFQVDIVTNQFWNLQSSETIQKKFKSRFGNKCKTHIQLVNTIPSEASGKTRQVISKVQAPSF